MKVVLIGQTLIDGREAPVWAALRGVLSSLGPYDTVTHTGRKGTLGAMVDSIKAHARGDEKRRFPRVDVMVPEIGRYPRAGAFEHNALQLLGHVQPDVIVYVGDALNEDMTVMVEQAGEEVGPVIEMAKKYPRVRVLAADVFIEERSG